MEYPNGEKTVGGQAEIRFYPDGHSDKAAIHIEDNDRITSYNVCYTKLLRPLRLFKPAVHFNRAVQFCPELFVFPGY